MKTKNTNKLFIYFLVSIAVLSGCASRYTLSKPTVQHLTIPASNFEKIWEQTTYTMQNDYMPPLGAASGKVCYLGATTNQDTHDVSCLDGQTGQLIWQESSDGASKILVTDNSVYLARSGGLTGVGRLGIEDGSLVWYQSVKGSGIEYASVFNNELQILAVPNRLFGLEIASGEVIKQYAEGSHAFLQTNSETFISQPRFSSTSNQTGETLWVTALGDVLLQLPIVLEDVILARTGRVQGTAYGVNRETGDVLWKTSNNIISNIAYSPIGQQAFVLDKDGNLKAINVHSGKEEILLQFSSIPFVLNGEKIVGGYELAYDDGTNMLFVLLGDSRQLIAFQEN